jgi:ubiquinone/menaquinone biosynthesis C-methylase UbiE
MQMRRDMAAYRPFPEIEGRDSLQVGIEVPLLVNALRVPKGGRLVEVGCGSGAALVELHKRLAPTWIAGVDIEEGLLRLAASRMTANGVSAELVHADVHTLPFPTASVDVVVDFGTAYHIPDAEGALREIARVLCPGGWFVHETPVSQMLAHPIRSCGRLLPWSCVPALQFFRTAMLWSVRTKAAE